MANTYKNIVIIPNNGSSNNDPLIRFSGANTTTNTDITLRVYPTSNGTLSFEGSAGQLFSITNDLSGVIFSVNDISGIPSLEIDANGRISLAQFSGNVGIGTTTPAYKLDVSGDVRVTGNVILGDSSTDTIMINGSVISLGNNQSIDSGTLFIDAVNNEIGIGTTNPTSNLHVIGTANISSVLVVGTVNVAPTITSAYATANLAFANANTTHTLTINAFDKANSATTIGSGAFGVANAAFGQANTATTIGSGAFDKANSATTIGSGAFNQANSATTIGSGAFDKANAAFGQANTATTIGSGAFDKANSAVQLGFSSVIANGNTLSAASNTDSLIIIAGTNITINSNTGNNSLTISSTGGGGGDIGPAFDTANAAFNQANTATTIGSNAYNTANASFNNSNTNFIITQTAYGQANTATTIGSNSFGQANTARIHANAAFLTANAAFAKANAATGGFTEVSGSPFQPTSDVSSIVITGLSSYKLIQLAFALQLTSSTERISLEARVTGGTWRPIGSTDTTVGNNDTVGGEWVIYGFNQPYDSKMVIYNHFVSGSAFDASDASNALPVGKVVLRAPSYNEIWDEIQLIVSGGSIEGSTSDQRGSVHVYGQA